MWVHKDCYFGSNITHMSCAEFEKDKPFAFTIILDDYYKTEAGLGELVDPAALEAADVKS